jgi:multidrug efflux pump subunit AcrA (membrane-fusion protein)
MIRIEATPARRLPVLLLTLALVAACADEHAGDEAGGHQHEDDHGGNDGDTGAGEKREKHADDENRVVLSAEQLAAAGVELVTAGPGRLTEALTLPGSIAPNADAVLHVTPRVPGQVREVHRNWGRASSPATCSAWSTASSWARPRRPTCGPARWSARPRRRSSASGRSTSSASTA